MPRSASRAARGLGGAHASAIATALGAGAALALAVAGCGGAQRAQRAPRAPAIAASATAEATPVGTARALPGDFLGFNGEALTGAPGLWSAPSFVAAVAALHPEAIRVFGGTTANFWDWRRGTFVGGSAAGGVAIPPPLAAARARVSVPLAAWARLLRAARAAPVYDLNLVSSTLADQLAMLRAARALGLAVTRVELGNELYLSRYRARFADGRAYGRVAARWAAAIKVAFPGVRVAASGYIAADPRLAVTARERSWNAGVLAAAHGVDALSIHPYFQAGLPAGTGPATARTATAMLLNPDLQWRGVQTRVLGRLPAGVAAWLTEYNLFDHVAAVHTTWAQGLALADYTLDLLDEPRVEQADIHALVSSAPFGALLTGSDGLSFGDAGAASFRSPPGARPPTRPFALSATGVAARALLEAVQGAGGAQRLAFTLVAPRRLVGAAATSLRGVLLSPARSGAARALILNLSYLPLALRPPAPLARARFEQLWGSPSTLVAGAGALHRSAGRVGAQGLVLPGYSVSVLAG